jgi:hypothetical protein
VCLQHIAYCFFIAGDLLKVWWKCKKTIHALDSSNPFKAPLMEAFEKREDLLMKNPVLAAAVYIDPRMHHKNSPKALLGELEQTAEVRITFIN